MTIFHGSENIIYHPIYGAGRVTNDYGRGFYCTEQANIAGEWACKSGKDGFVNQYSLAMEGLSVCRLNESPYHILNWLALLTRYRGYWQRKSIAEDAKDFLQEKYAIDISGFDVIIGYRADDSYFSFAQDFMMGTISLQKLAEAMRLGKLGEQVVLKSQRAFANLVYETNTAVSAEVYYRRKVQRDLDARRAYAEQRSVTARIDEIYILDIMRGRVSEDELRI